jgi:hypothetical protein
MRGSYIAFNTFKQEPDAWLVIRFGPGEYDHVPYYIEEGTEEEAAKKHGGELIESCGTEEAAQRSVRACQRPPHQASI